ncbi:hypothetical protein [Streptomyces minutiscleroticus]|uniref:Uncharacterized protein n=1 Tax=Streptomyces minutiscleroticus TaxID=68238 RepID=A0A918KLW1_9ACTN|nr:hypothetical protein [Streptomyces minutiscleroticus]GGX67455.1 hypothetical protein GCM10010358_22250 [Streptomyces minutiscleroticus]
MGVRTRHATADLRMRRCAAEFVRRVSARSRLPLDYSVDSLGVVDFIVDEMRGEGREPADAGRVLFELGAYTGEVLVRRVGAVWVEFDPEQRELFGRPVGVRTPDGRLWNPLGKVVRRFETGGRESVRALYREARGLPRPSPPRRPGPVRGR